MSTRNKETFLFAEPEPKPVSQPQKLQPAQKLLDWLQRWEKDTVCVRDIRIYGPSSIRDQKNALDAARTLVKNGWLTPLKVRRYDAQKWQITRRLIVHPDVAQPK